MGKFEHFYWGKLVETHETPKGEFRITAHSAGISAKQAESYAYKVLNQGWETGSLKDFKHGYVMASDGDNVIFAHLRPNRIPERGHLFITYHGVVLPPHVLNSVTLHSLADSLGREQYAPVYETFTPNLPALEVPQDSAVFAPLLKRLKIKSVEPLLMICDLLLKGESQLVITNAPEDPDTRLALIQACMMLLPSACYRVFTFSTSTFDLSTPQFSVKFRAANSHGASSSNITVSWDNFEIKDRKVTHPYLVYLNHRLKNDKKNDIRAIVEESRQVALTFQPSTEVTTCANFVVELRLLGVYLYLEKGKPPEDTTKLDYLSDLLQHLPLNEEKTHLYAVMLFELALKTQQYSYWKVLFQKRLVERYLDELATLLIQSENWLASLDYWLGGERYTWDVNQFLLLYMKHVEKLTLVFQDKEDLFIAFSQSLLFSKNLDFIYNALDHFKALSQRHLFIFSDACVPFCGSLESGKFFFNLFEKYSFPNETYLNFTRRLNWSIPVFNERVAELYILGSLDLAEGDCDDLLRCYMTMNTRNQLFHKRFNEVFTHSPEAYKGDDIFRLYQLYQTDVNNSEIVSVLLDGKTITEFMRQTVTASGLIERLNYVFDGNTLSTVDDMENLRQELIIHLEQLSLSQIEDLRLSLAFIASHFETRTLSLFRREKQNFPLRDIPQNWREGVRWLITLLDDYNES